MKRINSFVASAALTLLIGSGFIFSPINVSHVCADQSTVDQGVDYGNTNSANVQSIPSGASATDVPGYSGTSFPETQYYHSGNTSAMQSEALQSITNGTANDASTFAYDQATNPKLQFQDTDPLLQNSDTISTDAITNPSVLTVPTGQCSVGNTTTDQTRIETCTAWMLPTKHACSEPLNVDVLWVETTNCNSGEGYSETYANYNHQSDFVRARSYCDFGAPAGSVAIQVRAHGYNHNSGVWQTAYVSENAVNQYVALSRPHWHGAFAYVPSFATGSCNGLDCRYQVTFYILSYWHFSSNGRDDPPSWKCAFARPHTLFGQPGLGPERNGVYCVAGTRTLSLNFQKPERRRDPVVTEAWGTDCDHLEAQVQ